MLGAPRSRKVQANRERIRGSDSRAADASSRFGAKLTEVKGVPGVQARDLPDLTRDFAKQLECELCLVFHPAIQWNSPWLAGERARDAGAVELRRREAR